MFVTAQDVGTDWIESGSYSVTRRALTWNNARTICNKGQFVKERIILDYLGQIKTLAGWPSSHCWPISTLSTQGWWVGRPVKYLEDQESSCLINLDLSDCGSDYILNANSYSQLFSVISSMLAQLERRVRHSWPWPAKYICREGGIVWASPGVTGARPRL